MGGVATPLTSVGEGALVAQHDRPHPGGCQCIMHERPVTSIGWGWGVPSHRRSMREGAAWSLPRKVLCLSHLSPYQATRTNHITLEIFNLNDMLHSAQETSSQTSTLHQFQDSLPMYQHCHGLAGASIWHFKGLCRLGETDTAL